MKRKTTSQIKNIGEALKQLEILINNLHKSTGANKHRFAFSSVFRSGEFGEFGLNDEQGEAYLSILDSLAPDHGIPPPRSRAEIDRALAKCILSAITPETKSEISIEARTKQSLAELKDALTSELKEWEIWRFIERITPPPEGFQFGKVFFCTHSHDSAQGMVKRMVRLRERNQRLRSSPAFSNIWPATIEQHTLCRVTLNAADLDAALQLAEFELQTTSDALNFFASLVYPSDRWPTLCSRPDSSLRHELHFYSDLTSGAWGCRTVPPRYREAFDPKIVSEDAAVEKAFNKVSQLLNGPSGGLGERLLSAIKWAGKGSASQKRENAFIFYAIALEALLLGQQHHECHRADQNQPPMGDSKPATLR